MRKTLKTQHQVNLACLFETELVAHQLLELRRSSSLPPSLSHGYPAPIFRTARRRGHVAEQQQVNVAIIHLWILSGLPIAAFPTQCLARRHTRQHLLPLTVSQEVVAVTDLPCAAAVGPVPTRPNHANQQNMVHFALRRASCRNVQSDLGYLAHN